MPEPMKCPYREKDGEFCDCYGPACMAYYEYVPTPLTYGQTNTCVTDQTPVPMCKKMLACTPSYGGCV